MKTLPARSCFLQDLTGIHLQHDRQTTCGDTPEDMTAGPGTHVLLMPNHARLHDNRWNNHVMIEAQLLRDESLLIVSPEHKLEAVDFERLRLLVDPYLEAHGELTGLLIDAESFTGWENFSGLLEHLRFVRDYQQRIRQVAAVTDKRFLAILPKVADYFAAAEVRHFDYQDRDRALIWLRTGGKQL